MNNEEEELGLEEARQILNDADYSVDVMASEQAVCLCGEYTAEELKAMLVLLANNEDF